MNTGHTFPRLSIRDTTNLASCLRIMRSSVFLWHREFAKMSMKISISSDLVKSPSIEIKFRLLKEKLRVRARRNAPHFILAFVLGGLFLGAQMLPSVLTNKPMGNASLVGAFVSSTVVAITTLVPLLMSVILGKASQQP